MSTPDHSDDLPVYSAGYPQRLIEQAITDRPTGRLRSSALDHIGLAEARLIQSDLGEVVRWGHEAAALVEQTLSDRVRVKLVELYQRTAAHNGDSGISTLRDRIRSILMAPSLPS